MTEFLRSYLILFNFRVSPVFDELLSEVTGGDYFAHYDATILPELLDQLAKNRDFAH